MTTQATKLVPTTLLTGASASYGSAPGAGVVQIIQRAVFCNTDAATHAITVNIVPAAGSASSDNEVINPIGRVLQPGETYVSPELAGMELIAGDLIFAFCDTASKVNMTISGLTVTP